MLADLKVKLAAVVSAVNNSVATAAAERIEKAKVRAAEMRAKDEKRKEESRELKYRLDALPGTDEEKKAKLEEIEQAMAEYQEICKLLDEVRVERTRAKKSGSGDRDQLVANIQEMEDEIRYEKERIESNPDVAFFGWHHQVEKMKTENPDQRLTISLINGAIEKGLLEEISGETARARQEAAKVAKAAKEAREAKEGWQKPQQQDEEQRQAPFFWVRIKPRGSTPRGVGEMEPDSHFRYISGGVDFYVRTTDGARKRLAFRALQNLWKAVNDAKKAAYEAAQDVKQHSHLELKDIAAGQTGQAWAEVTVEKPWEPTFFNRETQKVERLMKDGKEVVNYGPIVLESPRSGVVRVLSLVKSGMYHPLRLAGAWEEEDGKLKPVDFKFFPGDNPFAGLRPVDDTVYRSPAQLGRLRAILCLAGGFPTPVKVVKEGNGGGAPVGPVLGPQAPTTRRGYRSDGSKAGEPRKGSKRSKRSIEDEDLDSEE